MPSDYSDPPGYGDPLIVILHAYGVRAAAMRPVVKVIRDEFRGAELIVPELPLGLASFADPNEIVAELLNEVDRRSAARRAKTAEGYSRIILVGYSIGGLLARKLYVVACGETEKAPFEPSFKPDGQRVGRRDWANKVERIILLAGMNRGWRISYHMNPGRAVMWWVGSFCLTVLMWFRNMVAPRPKDPLIFSVRRGATFITQLRIQWIRMRQAGERDTENAAIGAEQGRLPRALTVQLLGSIDDYVAPTDNIDLVAGGDFAYLDMPWSGHVTVIAMDGSSKESTARREIFRRALIAPADELIQESLLPQDNPSEIEDRKKQHVVFVVHGIRDEGYWTQKVARKVLLRALDDDRLAEFATETASYGFFPMLPFLFSRQRREKVEWFMDQYAEIIARYPAARLYYVGHSNGTYCLARALQLYPCCRFERVVFAGSVVRTSFNWSRFMNGHLPQVGSVLNYVATADWVVAGFPRLFEFFGLGDLGSAGHNGFSEKEHPSLTGRFQEVTFVRGSHGAAIHEKHWEAIASYVYSGTAEQGNATRQNLAVKVIGAFPPLAWLLAVVVALAGGGIAGVASYFVIEFVCWALSAVHLLAGSQQPVALTLAVVAGLAVIWMGVNKL